MTEPGSVRDDEIRAGHEASAGKQGPTEQGTGLPATLRSVSIWLVVVMTVVYVGYFEAGYRSDAACRGAAQWTRVVVDPPLPGVPEPVVAIGSNAGYVIVVSGAECKAGKTNAASPAPTAGRDGGHFEAHRVAGPGGQDPAPTAGRDGGHFGDVLLDLGRQVSGRVRFLWPWRDRSSDEDLPQAVVLPLSRVQCMYNEPANPANGADTLCTARTSTTTEEPDTNPPRLAERLKTEIRNKLEEENPECVGDLRISPPVVFRPYTSDQLAATAGPDSLDHAIQSLQLEDADGAQLYVFGYASADGPGRHNRTLSKQRADHVSALVEETTRQVADTFPMGEDHLVNGVAESRGARLVACVPPQPSQ